MLKDKNQCNYSAVDYPARCFGCQGYSQSVSLLAHIKFVLRTNFINAKIPRRTSQ